MNIIKCLLNTENSLMIQGKAVSELIVLHNKIHLWSERQEKRVDTVIIHYISAVEILPDDPYNLEAIIKIFCDLAVSSHYIIDREGIVRQLVPEEKKAWHCGHSIMPEPDSREGVNEFSIGVELIATKESGFTDKQYNSLGLLCSKIEGRWRIENYLGHEDIAGERAVSLGLRPDFKPDPGILFDWKRFFEIKRGFIS